VSPDPESITAACFPTPEVLIRSSVGDIPSHVTAFAALQAQQARKLYRVLTRELLFASDIQQRTEIVTSVFIAAEQWRHQVAVSQPYGDGRYSAVHAQRFREFITDDTGNYFPIGEPEKYRDGAQWNSASYSYTGGSETPASRAMRRFADLAKARFDGPDCDVVANEVTLPGGRSVPGMRLLRGQEATKAADAIVARIAARGGDGSRIARTIDGVYTANATAEQRHEIFHAAMALIARQHDAEAGAAWAWLDAAYLLNQAPRRKRGADATIRTFLVAAGLHLLGRPPTLLHDLDYRAYVHTQERFTAEVGVAMSLAPARPPDLVRNEASR
jgi:hypothetical protein